MNAPRYTEWIDLSGPIAPWLHRVAVSLGATDAPHGKPYLATLSTVMDRLDRLVGPVRAASEYRLRLTDLEDDIQHAIDLLPFNHRICVTLYYLGGHSSEEIARLLDCPVGTVKSRLHYGRKVIRQHLIHKHAGAKRAGLRPGE